MIIINDVFSEEEKRLFDFILKQNFKNKDETINYINALTAKHIIRDYSPFHRIIEFRTPNIKEGYTGMSCMIRIQLMRKDENSHTIFTLYAKDGFPFEFEIYSADGSIINTSTFFDNTQIKTETVM